MIVRQMALIIKCVVMLSKHGTAGQSLMQMIKYAILALICTLMAVQVCCTRSLKVRDFGIQEYENCSIRPRRINRVEIDTTLNVYRVWYR